MHVGAAQLLVGRLLSGGHLHQGRPAQEDLGPVFDHHRVVGHTGDVGATGGGVAEDQGHGGNAQRRELGHVAKPLASRHEHFCLGGKVGTPRLDQVDERHPVLARDVLSAQ